MPDRTAVIFGVSGIVGRAVADHLLAEGGWRVVGVARGRPEDLGKVEHVGCDLTDAAATKAALAGIPATHAFFATWSRQPTERENCRVNGAMIANAVEAIAARGRLRHVALVTGLKHYLGSFENYARQELDTPFTEDLPRVPGDNFYYTQEDILFAAAAKRGFTWSVARPHTIIGYAPGNAMNLGTSLAVYASLCKETGLPFRFPGSPQQYAGLVDMTDARLLARHLAWSATTPAAADTAFNVVNGDVFRWKKMWGHIARYFEIEPAAYPGAASPLAAMLADTGADWDRIVARRNLKPYALERIAPWWHVDADLGRTQEVMADMSRSRELG
ncbi:MAG: SDR family oxidoreductase, partial [Methylobacteriaceae bacterium]|nr:SDR family oxidoreductase [Methylobacteriaceae bacterium]